MSDEITDVAGFVAALIAEVGRLQAVILEAADLIAQWGACTGKDFQEEWDLDDDVARIRAAALEQP